jgi:hypothetical protein
MLRVTNALFKHATSLVLEGLRHRVITRVVSYKHVL